MRSLLSNRVRSCKVGLTWPCAHVEGSGHDEHICTFTKGFFGNSRVFLFLAHSSWIKPSIAFLPCHTPFDSHPPLSISGICQEEASICSLRGILRPPLCHSVPDFHPWHGGSVAHFWPGEEAGRGAGMDLRLVSFVRQTALMNERAAPGSERKQSEGQQEMRGRKIKTGKGARNKRCWYSCSRWGGKL